MNRVVLDGGLLLGGQIVRGGRGTSLTYDAAGQRMSATRDAVLSASVEVWEPGEPQPDQPIINAPQGGRWVTREVSYAGVRTESFRYAADGQLGAVTILETGYRASRDGTVTATAAVDRAAGSATFNYDGAGRQTRQRDYDASGERVLYDHQQRWSSGGRLEWDYSSRFEAGVTLTAETSNDHRGGAALGQVVAATTTTKRDDAVQGTTVATNTFVWRGGGAQIAKTTTTGQTASTTRYDYGVGGRLEAIAISDGRPRTVSIVSDLSGQVLARDESDDNTGTGDPHQRWYRFNGNERGHVGNDGGGADDYAGSIAMRGFAQQSGPFGNNRSYGPGFSKSIDAITSYEQGASGGGYTVRGGDTLAGIATQLWGDAGLWYKLAAANGLTASAALTPGATLAVPAGVIRSTYNADQIRPYDPADAIGDVSPVSAQPTAKAKKSNKCGTFGKILLIAVAVAVSVALPGSGFVMGAVNGLAGSLVSQAVGLATGIQDKFSWKGAALAALAGGIGGALGPGGSFGADGAFSKVGGSFVQGALRGAVGSVASQGIGLATGLQSRFDFAGAAVAGSSAASETGRARDCPAPRLPGPTPPPRVPPASATSWPQAPHPRSRARRRAASSPAPASATTSSRCCPT